MFCSRSEGFELETTMAIEATALMPEPKPPISYATKDEIRKAVGFEKDESQYSPTYWSKMKSSPAMMATSLPILCKYRPPNMHESM